jgi:heptosyltransferase-1
MSLKGWALQESLEVYMPRNILIIRTSAIGDVVMASPLIAAVKQAYPESRLAWLAEPGPAELLEGHPMLDEVICWDKPGWKRFFNAGRWLELGWRIYRFARALKIRRFDMVLDAQGLFRSRLMAFLTGAQERVGFASKEPGRRLMTRLIPKKPPEGMKQKTMGAEYLRLMRAAGAKMTPLPPDIRLSPAIFARMGKKLAQMEVSPCGPYIVFCPHTTRAQKHWFEERWHTLAEDLWEAFALPIVIPGGGGDGPATERIRKSSHAKIVNLCGMIGIAEAAALIQGASLVIGVDTGLVHLAAGFEIPAVALFGATCPYLAAPGGRVHVIYHKQACSPCRRRPTCEGRFDCMRAIREEEVLQAAQRFIGGEDAQKSGRAAS